MIDQSPSDSQVTEVEWNSYAQTGPPQQCPNCISYGSGTGSGSSYNNGQSYGPSFNSMDTDGSQSISQTEFEAAIVAYHPDTPPEITSCLAQCEFGLMDTSPTNGQLSDQEFSASSTNGMNNGISQQCLNCNPFADGGAVTCDEVDSLFGTDPNQCDVDSMAIH